ncbi:MAG: hypothetical protein IJV75_00985 [Alphaproteobacteria bacterium]|nr:hypothetical protein [Alphaproteobacteria bacterium]
MAKFLWKMSKKTVRLFLRGIEITVALIIVLLGLFFWRLSVSPMNVDFLVPQLKEHFVPKDLPVNIDVNSIVLRAEVRDEGILHLQIKDLSVLREDGSVITDLPDIELSYGLWRILSLNYMPDALVLKDAFLQAVLDEEGNLYLQSKDTDRERSEETPPIKVSDFNGFIGYLMQFHRLALENAQVLIDDKRQDKQFSVPRLNLLLENDGSDEHVLSVNAEVMAQNQTFNLALQAVFNGKTRQMPFELTFDSLNVSSLRRLIPVLQDAKINIKGGFYGTLDLKNSDKNIRNIISELSFKIINERPGTVNLPAPLTNEYKVDGMLIQGAFAPHLEALKIDKSSLKTGQVQASLEVDITGIGAFLDTHELSHIKTVLKSVVKNVKTEQVPNLWPSALGPDAHTWVKQNLSNGGLKTADFTLYFDGAELVDLFGDIKASGVSVDYLAPMPVVHNVSATVHLYPDKVDIFATSGDLGTIKLKKADLHFTDLQDDISNANMIIEAEGPVKEVMQLIDSKPLEFARAFGINPAATGGKGTVKTTLNFPLISSLDINQVKVDVSAEIQEGIFPTPIDGENISNGKFQLSVNNQRLELNGTADIRQVPITLKWTEYFQKTKQNVNRSIYDISGTISDAQIKPFFEDIDTYFTGEVPVSAIITKDFDDKTTITAQLDLTKATVPIYPIGITKDMNNPMTATILTHMEDTKAPTSVAFEMSGTSPKIDIKGSVDWQNGINLQLEKVIAPKNDFAGYVVVDKDLNSNIKLQGTSWNMSELFDMPIFKRTPPELDENGEEKEQIANVQIAPPNIDLNVDLKSLILNVQKPLKFVQMRGKRKGYKWQHLNISAFGSKPLEIHYIPQTKELKGESDDLGDLLARLNATDRFFGGKMRINAKQNNAGSFVGEIAVRQFNLKDPGFIIQAVTVLGIVDGIRGKELNFKKAIIPFELTPYQNVYINDGYASGTSLGLTFKGRVSLGKLALSGQVIPAYAINSLPGKIPLIGNLFKDGAGGGLLGVRYELKGTAFNPKVEFNTLSSIAPGVLGVFFE